MEQPALTMNNATSSSQPNPVSQQTQQKIKMIKKTNNNQSTRRLPTPEELISHYEKSKGMDTKQASVKVIHDLQNALFRLVKTNNKTPHNNNNKPQQQHHQTSMTNSGSTMALRMLDMKIDTKPGFIQMFGIGVASTAAFRGLETFVLPHIIASFGNIWSSVHSAATGSDPSNSSI